MAINQNAVNEIKQFFALKPEDRIVPGAGIPDAVKALFAPDAKGNGTVTLVARCDLSTLFAEMREVRNKTSRNYRKTYLFSTVQAEVNGVTFTARLNPQTAQTIADTSAETVVVGLSARDWKDDEGQMRTTQELNVLNVASTSIPAATVNQPAATVGG